MRRLNRRAIGPEKSKALEGDLGAFETRPQFLTKTERKEPQYFRRQHSGLQKMWWGQIAVISL